MAMENLDHPSRREFVQRVAAAAGVIGVSGVSGLLAFEGAGPGQRPKPDAVLVELEVLRGSEHNHDSYGEDSSTSPAVRGKVQRDDR